MPRGHFNHAGRIGMVGGSLPKGQTNLTKLFSILKGGSGSGNFGHAGRKGIRGGSASVSKSISVSEIAEALNGFSYGGLISEVTRTDEDSGEVMGVIRNSEGDKVGEFERIFDPLNKIVYHEMFLIRKEYEGKGFGSAFYQHSERTYKESGIEKIELDANMEVGGYSWARVGFDFADSQSQKEINYRFSNKYFERYGESPPTMPTKPWEFAAYEGPDGYRIGKDTLLGSNWKGSKDLKDNEEGYQIGELYYESRKR